MLEKWTRQEMEMSEEMYEYYERKISQARTRERIAALLDSAAENVYICPLQIAGLQDLARIKYRDFS